VLDAAVADVAGQCATGSAASTPKKRAIMQKLLTGEWRLNGVEVQANRLAGPRHDSEARNSLSPRLGASSSNAHRRFSALAGAM